MEKNRRGREGGEKEKGGPYLVISTLRRLKKSRERGKEERPYSSLCREENEKRTGREKGKKKKSSTKRFFPRFHTCRQEAELGERRQGEKKKGTSLPRPPRGKGGASGKRRGKKKRLIEQATTQSLLLLPISFIMKARKKDIGGTTLEKRGEKKGWSRNLTRLFPCDQEK